MSRGQGGRGQGGRGQGEIADSDNGTNLGKSSMRDIAVLVEKLAER